MDSSDAPFFGDSISSLHFCKFCKYLHIFYETLTCDAFPEGIPKELHSGLVFHDKPIPGQKNNIVFTSKYKIME